MQPAANNSGVQAVCVIFSRWRSAPMRVIAKIVFQETK
jgi:hypothetical protein